MGSAQSYSGQVYRGLRHPRTSSHSLSASSKQPSVPSLASTVLSHHQLFFPAVSLVRTAERRHYCCQRLVIWEIGNALFQHSDVWCHKPRTSGPCVSGLGRNLEPGIVLAFCLWTGQLQVLLPIFSQDVKASELWVHLEPQWEIASCSPQTHACSHLWGKAEVIMLTKQNIIISVRQEGENSCVYLVTANFVLL